MLDKLLVATQLCECINNLHSKNIFNIDIKPSNVLFDSSKQPFISGWDIQRSYAKVVAEENLDDEDLDDQSNIAKGYASPELLNDPLRIQ